MRFKGLDLNLLVALDALMTERKLTAAARSINLSQPAMSAAITRLRTYFRDELFTMNGRELVPTPRAEALAPAVREALLHIHLSIISWDPFNPAQSDRSFRIILSDFMTLMFLERVVVRVAREAPAVSFELLPFSDEPDELLRRGDVDFLILPEMFMSHTHPRAKLFDERFVCVSCPTNQKLPPQLSIDNYVSMGHVAAQFGKQRPSVEEWLLREHGLRRRVEVAVPGFTMIPSFLSGTDRIATLPLRLAMHFAKAIPLRITELPQPIFPAFTEAVQWPAPHSSDPASLWMREIFLQEASRVEFQSETSAHALSKADGAIRHP
ncbi:LysR-type transcription regulator of nodulation genes; nodulation protein NodD1 (plasmid) [Sinorhizobium fredii NGR234]|uniref:Nodulation protein D 1 n=1 Tax=Sinorhizobium fredii (strain NBRC 101917 / NGR234) TaxID=394 RepID=NODD1_SINFN|nr:transcriptional regulator NodD1 [Sinorhizobium fredii]P55359.1 RecName: Full=Nodulation protein D 1 [Sinorhizobium fredii NGR234]QJX14350.1 LysR family transcriptional regulator [synthetic construct]AAB91609.1 LysR-type transcription regulator of nodulation genes; nodulation protein NodD1 [Sinorhizobium fredii NGR234]QJX14361.1 LysR family transcriptional regulator [synthetic construct]UTS59870.1 nodulation protein NodD1 [synthetic construct]